MANLLTAVPFSRDYMADLPDDVRSDLVGGPAEHYSYLLET